MNIITKILHLAMLLMDCWDRPEVAVSTLKEFEVDRDMLAMLQNAGTHPLKVAGVLYAHIDHQNIVT